MCGAESKGSELRGIREATSATGDGHAPRAFRSARKFDGGTSSGHVGIDR